MRYRWRVGVFASVLLVGAAAHVPPAGAGFSGSTDPTGDVEDQDGAAATAPRVDLTRVEYTNSPNEVEMRIRVDELVAFNSPAWQNLVITGILVSEDGETRLDWNLYSDGTAFATLTRADTFFTCITDASQDATDYILNITGACARAVPRTVQGAAEAMLFGGDGEFVADRVPDSGFSSQLATSAEDVSVARIAGTDRTLTAIELSRASFLDDGAASVVVAASQTFPDALAGGPLAYYRGAPLLLTNQAELDPRTGAEIDRVLAPGGTVYVLGGTAALADRVVTDIGARGYDVQRLAGIDRFETAVAIAEEIASVSGLVSLLFADGRSFTDALLAGAAAPSALGVVLLTDGAAMPAATDAFLRDNSEADRISIGTTAATATPGDLAIQAADAASLSVAVAEALAPINGVAAVASAVNFPDSLAGGPHIAGHGGPLLLTDPQRLSEPVGQALFMASERLREVVVYGGTAAVSPAVQAAIGDAVNPPAG